MKNRGESAAAAGWSDYVYVSTTGDVNGAAYIGSFFRSQPLAAGASYTQTSTFTLPAIGDGSYRVIVVTDAASQVFEHGREANNTLASTGTVPVGHSNLVAGVPTAPATAQSADTIEVRWTVTNAGTRAAPGRGSTGSTSARRHVQRG